MPKEILLYKRVDSESSIEFIDKMNELDGEEEAVARVNGPGGEPEYGFGMVAKWSEYQGPKRIKVDGKAYSMYAFLLLYSENNECLDVSEFLFHRAAYPDWFEGSEYFTEPLKENLARINKSMEKAFRAKIDIEAFENLKQVKDKGITVDSLFSMESRQDVFLSAKDAKKIGLVKKINTITPQIAAEIETISASIGIKKVVENPKPTPIEEPINNENMTAAEFKAKHPEAYAEIVKLATEEEKDRVGSIMAFADVDLVECKKILASGKKLSETDRSEFSLKAIAKMALKATENEAADPIQTAEQKVADKTTPVVKKAEKEKQVEAFNDDVMKNLGLTKEALTESEAE
jgi:ATP-dependent protease ClpP protease subunit